MSNNLNYKGEILWQNQLIGLAYVDLYMSVKLNFGELWQTNLQ